MSTVVALLQPLPLPSPASPLPNLPAWFERMDKSLRLTTIYDPVKNDIVARDRLTVCETPSPQQRADLERHKAYLDRLLMLMPINGREHAKKTFGLVAKLMLAKPSRAGGPEAAEARMEAYQMALDDVPWWAVAEAIRRWHRGECHRPLEQAPDYTWAPGTADLRRYAWRVVSEVKKRIEAVDKVLSAEQYDPATDFRNEQLRRQKAWEERQAAPAEPKWKPTDADLGYAKEKGLTEKEIADLANCVAHSDMARRIPFTEWVDRQAYFNAQLARLRAAKAAAAAEVVAGGVA